MTWFKCGGGGGGIPAVLKSLMNSVFNKKFGTAEIYPPEAWPDTVNLMGPLEEKTVSGSVAAFNDGSDDVPLKKCEITVPANLTGVSSVEVVQTGKNLFNKNGKDAANGYVAGYWLRSTGTESSNADYYISEYIAVKSGETITLQSLYGNAISFCEYDDQKTYITGTRYENNSTLTVTLNANTRYIRITVYSANEDITMVEYGSTATTYAPYVAPTTHTASLGRTIYGGEVDVVNGTGAETAGKAVFTGSETWQLYSNETFWYTTLSADNIKVQQNCTTSNGVIVRYQSTSGQLRVYIYQNEGVVDTTTNMNALLSNGVSFAYPYETPEDFTFTAVPVNSLLDDNTLWSDAGDLEVVYRSTGTETIIQPTLVTKEITENGTYTAAADNADGYSSVTVIVSTGAANIETVLGDDPLIEITGVSGTDVSRTMWTRTAAAAEKIVFHPNTKVKTNTGSNDGYFKVLKNSVVVVSTYANTSTTTAFTIPDIELSAGDVVEIVGGFDNSHTSCWFDLYSTITVVS